MSAVLLIIITLIKNWLDSENFVVRYRLCGTGTELLKTHKNGTDTWKPWWKGSIAIIIMKMVVSINEIVNYCRDDRKSSWSEIWGSMKIYSLIFCWNIPTSNVRGATFVTRKKRNTKIAFHCIVNCTLNAHYALIHIFFDKPSRFDKLIIGAEEPGTCVFTKPYKSGPVFPSAEQMIWKSYSTSHMELILIYC